MTVTLVSDTFAGRTVAPGGWGTASDGTSIWTTIGGGAFESVSGGEGLLQTSTPSQFPTPYVSNVSAADVDIVTRVSIGASGNNVFLYGRLTGITSPTFTGYGCGFTNTTFFLRKSVNNTATNFSTLSSAFTVTSFYWLRLRIVGSNISAKFWLDGNSEPANWTLTATDTSITGPGKVACFQVGLTTTSAVSVDHLTVLQAYNMQGQGRAKFSTRQKLSGVSRAKFFTRRVLGIRANATFRILSIFSHLKFLYSGGNYLKDLITGGQALKGKFVSTTIVNPFSTVQYVLNITNQAGVTQPSATSVTVTVTFPDGTTSSFSLGSGVVNSGAGNYTLTYASKMPGINREVWSVVNNDGTVGQFMNDTAVTY